MLAGVLFVVIGSVGVPPALISIEFGFDSLGLLMLIPKDFEESLIFPVTHYQDKTSKCLYSLHKDKMNCPRYDGIVNQ